MKWLSKKGKVYYEQRDSMQDLVLKYANNEKQGTYVQLEEKFGRELPRIVNIFKAIEYLKYIAESRVD